MKSAFNRVIRCGLRADTDGARLRRPIRSAVLPVSDWRADKIEFVRINVVSSSVSPRLPPVRSQSRTAQKHRVVPRNSLCLFFALLPLALQASGSASDPFAALVADRTAVERIYYNHRLGTKPPFDHALPAAEIERLVKADLRKAAILARVYHVEITNPQIESEIRRIDTETRAPEILAEIKAALGNDPARFAHAVAKPIIVDRELRSHFENDDRLHALQREQAETVRRKLLAARHPGDSSATLLQTLKETNVGTVAEVTWRLGARPEATPAPPPVASPTPVKARSLKYSLDATAQFAQSLSFRQPEESPEKCYLEDLSPELRKVLRAQLQEPGDVSAVVETPNDFLLFVARDRTEKTLSAAALSIPKRSFEQWLSEQKE
ncbi:MAG: hypothetical protein DME23_08150 [Verrucomicrobia bacterium]|nr:MAG: hypothetical protein DME23_08150 [Verrucomicrobiota bacterium]